MGEWSLLGLGLELHEHSACHVAAVEAMSTSQRDVAEILSKEYIYIRDNNI